MFVPFVPPHSAHGEMNFSAVSMTDGLSSYVRPEHSRSKASPRSSVCIIRD